MTDPQPINLSTYQLINFNTSLGDNSLILGHRNSEWCGHGPVLEQDIAITNISLDLIGQARYFYQYAASLLGGDTTEDSLAYTRDVREFKNCLLAEQPNGDWGQTILRQFFFSAFQYFLMQELQQSRDEQLASIASKTLKEVTYHLRWSSEWVIRLGDGTEESHARMEKAMDALWPYTAELFDPAPWEKELAEEKICPPLSTLLDPWESKMINVLGEAGLAIPRHAFQHSGGKMGIHTEHLGYILAELQFVQRAYPGNNW